MIFDTIKKLHELGWNPIPIFAYLSFDKTKREKTPPVKWKHFADAPHEYTVDVIESWQSSLSRHEALGIALVTGKQRDGTFVVCVDLDPPTNGAPLSIPSDLAESFTDTMSTTTPSGGRHYYFKYEGPLTLINQTNIFKKDKNTETVIDLRAKSGLSVIAPTQIWEWEWVDRQRSSTEMAKTKSTPLRPVPKLTYTTLDYYSPSSLAPLPESIITAFLQKEILTASVASTKDAKQLWKKVVDASLPDTIEGQTAHEMLLSWSMKLVSCYLEDLHSQEDAQHLYKRFREDIDFIVQDRLQTGKRTLEEPYIERIFFSAIEKMKKNRSVQYKLAKPYLDPLLTQRIADAQRGQWEALKVTKILNYSTHLFAADDTNKGFELSLTSYTRQQDWRTLHLLNFGAPMLPKISIPAFEAILADIPIISMEHTTSSPKMVAQIIISNWLENISTVGNDENSNTAMKTASSMGFGGYNSPTQSILYFKLHALQSSLKDEGFGTINPAKLAQILEELKVKTTDTLTMWTISRNL